MNGLSWEEEMLFVKAYKSLGLDFYKEDAATKRKEEREKRLEE
jgi:hypothetical protein